MRRQASRVTGYVCVLLCLTGPRTFCEELDSQVAAVVKGLLDEKKHASLAVGVITPQGKRTFGFGTVTLEGKEQAPDEQTLYEIGSITKVFTGTLLAQLVLEKKVKPDDLVQPWLSAEWVLPRRDDRDVTFLHLATHASGLPVEPPGLGLAALLTGTIEDPYGKFDGSRLSQTLSGIRLTEPIGCRYSYSNLGIGLLGHALAKADGAESYEALVTRRLLHPLGMMGTTIRLSEEQKKRMAPGHNTLGKPVSGWNFATLEACGGVRSNVHDLLLFLEGATTTDPGPLQPAFALAQQPWRELPGERLEIGLCWMRSRLNRGPGRGLVLWHNGGTGGYASFMGFNTRTRVGVVILCNSPERIVDDFGWKLLETLAAAKL